MWSYVHNVLVGFDQFCNTILGGYPDETISARSYRASKQGKLWGRVLNTMLGWIETNHGELAAEGDLQRSETVEHVEDKVLDK